MNTIYDVAIIGAGPAGATLARLICKQYKVLLVDKRQLSEESRNNSIVKSCGGLLAPDAQKMLGELGLGVPKDVLVGPQLFAVKTIDLQQNIERYYQRFYINVDRERFDRWLVSIIPSEVDARFGYLFKSYKEKGNYLDITLSDGKNTCTEQAKVLIGADGALSLVRKEGFSLNQFPKKYVSIQEWFHAEEALPYLTAVFDKEVTDYYSWAIPKENYLIVGSAVPVDEDASQKFELLKKKLIDYGFNLSHPIKKEGAFIFRPTNNNHICTGSNKIALVGEAAGWISPSSAEGLSYAFRSSLALSKSLLAGLDGFNKRYRKYTEKLQLNILLKNLKSPFMYNNLLRKLVMQSGIEAMDVKQ